MEIYMFWNRDKKPNEGFSLTKDKVDSELLPIVRSREIIKKSREDLYKKVVKDLRAEQIGKENQIHIDQAKLKLFNRITTESIMEELGLPPYKDPRSIQNSVEEEDINNIEDIIPA